MTRWLVLMVIGSVTPLLGACGYFLWVGDPWWMRAVYALTKGFTLVFPVLALVLLAGERWFPRPSLPTLRAAGEGLISGLALTVPLVVGLLTVLEPVLSDAAPAIRAKVAAFGIAEYFWLFALGLSLVHSGVEEYYWRWFLFGSLARRLPQAGAHALAAAAFAAHHVVVASVYAGWAWGLLAGLAVAVAGGLWSWLYRRHGHLGGAWISHAVVDLGLMGVGWGLLTGSLG